MTIAEAYERFKHFDVLLSRPVVTSDYPADDPFIVQRKILYDLWMAVKDTATPSPTSGKGE